ncbi:MAG TPA: HAD hydrolase family protein [Gemmatimonadaceae bacterium]|nr:HAD hydrolase family protein [Gemmatimonadaceae bacterium]
MIEAALAKSIKLVAFDVDGVMTDGGIYLGDVDGRRLEFKRYEIQDGLGIVMLKLANVKVAIVTGRVSESVRLRGIELSVDDVAQDPDGHKLAGFQRILDKHGVTPSEVAFVGDDFPDVSLLRIVGLPVAVGNAVPEVRAICTHQLTRHGGRGAVREFAEDFLKIRGEWDMAWNAYVDARSKPRAAEDSA